MHNPFLLLSCLNLSLYHCISVYYMLKTLIFRKCHTSFLSNEGNLGASKTQSPHIQVITRLQFYANDLGTIAESFSCENPSHKMSFSRLQKYSFFANPPKELRKIWTFEVYSIPIVFWKICKWLILSNIRKIPFFANDLICISKSKSKVSAVHTTAILTGSFFLIGGMYSIRAKHSEQMG